MPMRAAVELAAIETRLPYLTIKADAAPPSGTKIK